ncbi:MAG: Glu-tRNA(Gln) amidotransferase subunit GatE [Candidatus Aenigmarchaeota archaeon]|nr:Glu-tRNA(Gln) amidotransferase subunit GatE [Candidatus Aenigmarchaeota archaeon]
MIDYKKIGFKCGIEIHNRLNTKTKLFCNCKPRFSGIKPISLIKRKLRAVAGELGQVDVAAMYEYLRDRTFFYNSYSDETCLIETDEEPPRSINREALEVALQVALLLKAEIPDEIHIMRKTVIDGSNTCAFQRTAIIGLNGVLETSRGKVGITNICLEEESAGIVKQEDNEITYRLDRLGIPLIEIGTAPDIKSPEHAKEVAEKLGMIIRSTGKSQRGIGVTRQDVNVSIAKGARVEIKGVQELDIIPKVIENEIKRQQELIAKGKKPKDETRVAKEDGTTEFTRPLPGGERMYPETDLETVFITKGFLSKIKIPETWEKKAKRFSKILPKEMVDQILRSEYLDLFEKFSKEHDPVLVANTFISTIKDLRRRGFKTEILTEEQFSELFLSVNNKIISKEAIPDILEILCKEKVSVKHAIEKTGLKSLTEEQLKELIREIFKKYPKLVKEKRISALMGEVMKEVRGKIDGKTVAKTLKEELKKP